MKKKKTVKRFILGALGGGVCAALTWGFFNYVYRPQPGPLTETLGPGWVHKRVSTTKPYALVWNWVEVDLTKPHEFSTTDGVLGEELPFRGMKTTEYCRLQDQTIAISGDFFEPWHSDNPLNYYPHVGDPCKTFGLAANHGKVYVEGRPGRPSLFVDKEGVPSFKKPKDVWTAVSGDEVFIMGGKYICTSTLPYHIDRHPRAVLGIGHVEGRPTLFMLTVDGRQWRYSEGATIKDLGDFMLKIGVEEAMNLDGGGTVTLCFKDQLLNCPIDNRIPGRQRPIANHFGLRLPL